MKIDTLLRPKTEFYSNGDAKFYCPKCGHYFAFALDEYCPQCGQHIDWNNKHNEELKNEILNTLSRSIYCNNCPLHRIHCDAENSYENFDILCKNTWDRVLKDIYKEE